MLNMKHIHMIAIATSGYRMILKAIKIYQCGYQTRILRFLKIQNFFQFKIKFYYLQSWFLCMHYALHTDGDD